MALRVKNRSGGNALATIYDYGFLLTLRRYQELPVDEWQQCFARAGAESDLATALRGSELVKWQFRGVAQTGLMVPRNLPGRQRKQKQLSWSAEVLFRVLDQHEPDHPLLVEAYRQATHTFLDAESAYQFLDEVQTFDWKLRELRARTNQRWMLAGVTMFDPRQTFIDVTVTLGRDVTLYPGTILQGDTTIGVGCEIGPDSRVVDSVVEDGAIVENSVVRSAVIGAGARVGPYASLSEGAKIMAGAITGPFSNGS